jgi:hypothetical protein
MMDRTEDESDRNGEVEFLDVSPVPARLALPPACKVPEPVLHVV